MERWYLIYFQLKKYTFWPSEQSSSIINYTDSIYFPHYLNVSVGIAIFQSAPEFLLNGGSHTQKKNFKNCKPSHGHYLQNLSVIKRTGIEIITVQFDNRYK